MSDRQIISTPSLFKIDESFDDPRFMRVRIKVLHDKDNYNKSDFLTSSLPKAKDSFANIPILANIITYTDEDGNEHMDYGGHDMHKELDAFNDGEKRVIYDEKVVGVVPENCNFKIIHDDELNKDFIWVDALIYRDYGNYCADILEERGGTTSVSAEVEFLKTAYDVKRKLVVVEEFRMLGITLLGEIFEPAMKSANATVSAFALEDNSRQEQLVNVMKELTIALNKYTATFAEKDSERKEEKEKLNKELFEKLCAQYSVTEEDITFEYSELDDVALTSAFAEHFDGDGGESSSSEGSDGDSGESGENSNGSSGEEGEGSDTSGTSETLGSDNGEENSEGNNSEGTDDDPSSSDNGSEDNDNSGDGESNDSNSDSDALENNSPEDDDYDGSTDSIPSNKLLYSITHGTETHEFTLSLNEEICAVTNLFNITYGDEDGDWYNCEVFPDHSFIAHGWYKHFKQKYSVKDGVYSLKGERTEVFAKYLTQEEIDSLEGLKAKFAETSNKLSLYESEPDKIALLDSEDYSLIRDTEEFKQLSKRDSYFSLSKEELTSKLESMLNTYAKELGKKNFSINNSNTDTSEQKTETKDFFAFARIKTESSFLDGLLGKNKN